MKRITLITLLTAFCFFGNGIAETESIRGKIEMNVPNTQTLTVFGLEFTTFLPEYAEYVDMIEGVFICRYDKEAGNLTKMKSHYQKTLKTEKWEHLIKVKDQLHVSLLFADEPGILHGIFISFTDKHNTTFVNIFGKIDFEKLGTLFGKLIESDSEFLKKIKIDKKIKIEK